MPASPDASVLATSTTQHRKRQTESKDAALECVKFMTSDEEQRILNRTYGSLPTVKGAYTDQKSFGKPETKVLQETLSTSAAPLPQLPEEAVL